MEAAAVRVALGWVLAIPALVCVRAGAVSGYEWREPRRPLSVGGFRLACDAVLGWPSCASRSPFESEVVRRGAFRRSLARWRKSGRTIPVLADHDGKVGAVVGRVDPRIAFETDQGLEVSGTLDISTELGRRVYSLVKSGALSWSIGYVVPKGGRRRKGELNELVEIDLAEISAVPVPANEGARTLSIKSIPPVQLVSFDVA